MLESWASGNAGEALGLATQLAQQSASPARDLKSVIQPWLRRGEALRAQGLWQQARSEFLMAASFSPRDVEANLGLADACRILGEKDQSERHYKLVLAEDGQHLRASLGLADLRQRQGRVAEAVEFLEEVEKSHPGSFPLLVNLAYGQMQLARGSDANVGSRLSRARVLFQRAAALEPGRPQARAGLGEVYFRMGQNKRALSELDRALLLEDSCHYRSWRGHALFALGRTDEAEQEVQTALLACPNLIDALVLLGNITADQSRYKRAREAWEQVLTLEPDNKAARFNLDQLGQSGVESLEQ
jgi:tetratricopeptide (TPR) repeat protein